MKSSLLLFFSLSLLVAFAAAGNDYLWGKFGENDILVTRDTVSKAFFVGVKVTQKYVFKQKDNFNAYTITAVKVIDQKKKNGATAVLKSGGPGSKGATIVFTSQRGHGIKDKVEIYGRL